MQKQNKNMKWKAPELILIYAEDTRGKGAVQANETQGVSLYNNFVMTTMDLGMAGFNVSDLCNTPAMFACSSGTVFTGQSSLDAHRIDDFLIDTNVYHFKGLSSAGGPTSVAPS